MTGGHHGNGGAGRGVRMGLRSAESWMMLDGWASSWAEKRLRARELAN